MIDYDFLDMDDNQDNSFDYSGFYNAQPVAVLPTPTITDCRIETRRTSRINPYTTRIGNTKKQILKLRRRLIAELRIRTNRYYKEA